MCIKLTNFRLPMFLSGPHHAEPDGCLRFAVSDVYKVTKEMCYRACAPCKILVYILPQHCYASLVCSTGKHGCANQKSTHVLKAP